MFKEWRDRREMSMDHKRTNQYLDQHGQRISSLDEIKGEGDLIGVVDLIGGFYAFVTNGYDDSIVGLRTTQQIGLFDQELNRVGSAEGNIRSVHFRQPEKWYFNKVSEDGDIKPNDEIWFRYSGGVRGFFGPGTLDEGVYRITSPDLVDRIRNTFSDPTKEVKY